MKKLLALVLAMSACCVFAACGDKDAKDSSRPQQQPSAPQQSVPNTPVTPPAPSTPAKLTKEEWNELVKFDIEQFSYVVSWGSGQMVYVFDGDYLEITRSNGVRKLMYTKEGESYYFYDNVSGEWAKWASTAEIYDEYVNEMRRMAALFTYEDFQYNATTNTYTAATLSTTETIVDVSCKVVDGKVTESKYTLNGTAYTVTLSYDPITLTLPDVEVMS